MKVTLETKIPNYPIGQSAINQLHCYVVDTQYIVRGDERLDIYFLETGASMRVSQVVYDRESASFADVNIDDFDFDKILDVADWFHTTRSLWDAPFSRSYLVYLFHFL